MSHETEFTGGGHEIIRVGDDADAMRPVLDQAIADGRQEADFLVIAIPIEKDLAYYGTSVWHFADDGMPVRANEMFGATLSTISGRQITIRGLAPVQAGEEESTPQLMLLATVHDE